MKLRFESLKAWRYMTFEFILNRVMKNDKSTSGVTAIDVANWFVARANMDKIDEETSEGITNLKLQKMLYFAQAAYLALNSGKPLFRDEIIAWQYGPVVQDVYATFKPKYNTNASAPIKKPTNSEYTELPNEITTFLENVWIIFGKFSAAKLVQMAHEHQPWKSTYTKDKSRVIDTKLMYAYYKGVFRTT